MHARKMFSCQKAPFSCFVHEPDIMLAYYFADNVQNIKIVVFTSSFSELIIQLMDIVQVYQHK